MVISVVKSANASAAPCTSLSVGVISSYVPSGHRVPAAVSAGQLPLLPGGRPNARRSSARSGSSGPATTASGHGVPAGPPPSTRHSTHPRLYVPNQPIAGGGGGGANHQSSSSAGGSRSSSAPNAQRVSGQSSHHGHHRIKPSSSGALVEHSFGASACSSLHSCHYHDEHSFISPCVKYSLFFFNLLFWIIGAALIGLGCWSLLEEYDYNLLKFRNIFDFLLHISLGLVFAGLIVFSMSFTGCLGALRENLLLIKLYSLMLLLLFIAEVILSSLAFIFPSTLSHFVKDRLSKDLITLYREDTNLQNLIDIIQMEFKCCGVSDNGFKDWSMNIYFNCSLFNPSSERCAVPFSCCRDFNTGLINIMCGYNMQNLSSVVEVNKYVFTRGCVEAMSELVERNMNLVAGICLGSALAQLFAMFLARSLQGQIFAQMERWM